MSVKAKKRVLLACCVWIVYFAAPDPRTVIDYLFGSRIKHSSYLYADSEYEVCRRVRRVINNGKATIYIENLSSHTTHVELVPDDMRRLIMLCHLNKNKSSTTMHLNNLPPTQHR